MEGNIIIYYYSEQSVRFTNFIELSNTSKINKCTKKERIKTKHYENNKKQTA